MANNQYANKIVINGDTKIDLTGDTVTAGDLRQGVTAHGADGAPITGSLIIPDPPSGTLAITGNGTYDVAQYASADVNVSSNPPKYGVLFIDYDGMLIEAWDATSVVSKTALPANPTGHTRLVAEGWNWSLADIKSYMTSYPNAVITVGQMYHTASGKTELDIAVTKVTGKDVSCNISGEKDWGDGTINTLSYHTYTNYGDYTIKCSGTTINSTVFGQGSSSTSNDGYWCTAAYIGQGVTSIGGYAFQYCYSLTNVTIPSSVTNISDNVFRYCYRFASVTIPSSVTNIGGYAFQNCYRLSSVAIPSSVTTIGNYALYYCYSLTSVAIPSSVTYTGSYAFAYCYSLTSVTIPSSMASLSNAMFYSCYSLASVTIPSDIISIGEQVFYYCYGLTSVTLPSGLTTIRRYAFIRCISVIRYDFTSATRIPSLTESMVFSGINRICKIIVPDALYGDWITDTNWTEYADYIYKASEVTD